jgi:hypothetical protein
MTAAPSFLWTVSLWLTHPDENCDDCMTGDHFATEAEARACAADPNSCFDQVLFSDCAFVALDGPGVHAVTERPGVAERARRQAAREAQIDRSEVAMQAGMAFGVDGYNDAMGW